MLHFYSLEDASLEHSWVTIGSFDGVHLGHQEIIKHLIEGARKSHQPAVVLTFYPHPSVVFGKRSGPFYLNTPQERENILRELGVDYLFTLQFSDLLANTSASDFVKQLSNRLGMKRLFIGHDFALGKGREGNESFLIKMGKEIGFNLHTFDTLEIDDIVVSSTKIRNLLINGNPKAAARLMGRNYQVSGKVIPGDQRGRTIGIPTANIQIDPEKLIPASGVYACKGFIEGDLTGRYYKAAVNIGIRPTFDGTSSKIHIEAHLLNFSGDLYGKDLKLEFLDKLRGEQKFSSVGALVDQIHEDILAVTNLVD